MGLIPTTKLVPFTARTLAQLLQVRSVTKRVCYNRVWWRYRTWLENFIAAANGCDVIFRHPVGIVSFLKAVVLCDQCGANRGTMRLRFQVGLSEEIDGVGHGVVAIRIEHRGFERKFLIAPVGRVMHKISKCAVVLCV